MFTGDDVVSEAGEPLLAGCHVPTYTLRKRELKIDNVMSGEPRARHDR